MPPTANQLHCPSMLACAAIGIPANIALLWLIRHHTSTELRPYSRILAQTAILDTASLFMNVLLQPLFLSRGPYAIVGAVGPALLDYSTGSTESMANRRWNVILFITWQFITTTADYSLPLTFYYRFTVMCRWVAGGWQPEILKPNHIQGPPAATPHLWPPAAYPGQRRSGCLPAHGTGLRHL
jgi:Serpentine type 7TM GPCR chemoreceptor Srd